MISIRFFALLTFLTKLICSTEQKPTKVEIYTHEKIDRADYYKSSENSSLHKTTSEKKRVYNKVDFASNRIVWNQYFAKPFRFELSKFATVADSTDNITIKFMDRDGTPRYALTNQSTEYRWEFEVLRPQNDDLDNSSHEFVTKRVSEEAGHLVFIDDTLNLAKSYSYLKYIVEFEDLSKTIRHKAKLVIEGILNIKTSIKSQDKIAHIDICDNLLKEMFYMLQMFFKEKSRYYVPSLALNHKINVLEISNFDKITSGLQTLTTKIKSQDDNTFLDIDKIINMIDIVESIRDVVKKAEKLEENLLCLMKSKKAETTNSESYIAPHIFPSKVTDALVIDVCQFLCEFNEIMRDSTVHDINNKAYMSVSKGKVLSKVNSLDHVEKLLSYIDLCCPEKNDADDKDKLKNTRFLINSVAFKNLILFDIEAELEYLKEELQVLEQSKPNEKVDTSTRSKATLLMENIDKCLESYKNFLDKHQEFLENDS